MFSTDAKTRIVIFKVFQITEGWHKKEWRFRFTVNEEPSIIYASSRCTSITNKLTNDEMKRWDHEIWNPNWWRLYWAFMRITVVSAVVPMSDRTTGLRPKPDSACRAFVPVRLCPPAVRLWAILIGRLWLVIGLWNGDSDPSNRASCKNPAPPAAVPRWTFHLSHKPLHRPGRWLAPPAAVGQMLVNSSCCLYQSIDQSLNQSNQSFEIVILHYLLYYMYCINQLIKQSNYSATIKTIYQSVNHQSFRQSSIILQTVISTEDGKFFQR